MCKYVPFSSRFTWRVYFADNKLIIMYGYFIKDFNNTHIKRLIHQDVVWSRKSRFCEQRAQGINDLKETKYPVRKFVNIA